MDFTMTHVRFGRSHLHPMGQLMNTSRSGGVPDPGLKCGIITVTTWIDQTQSFLYHWQWILQTSCMTTSFVWFSSMITKKHLLWLMKYRRNRISFVSFEIRVSLIKKTLALVSDSVRHIDYSVSDNRVEFAPAPTPSSYSSLSHPHWHTKVHGFFSQPNLCPCVRFCESHWI